MQELPYTRTYLLFFNLSVRIKALSKINLNMTLISAKNFIPVNFQSTQREIGVYLLCSVRQYPTYLDRGFKGKKFSLIKLYTKMSHK